jgi:hypothetical protein
MIAAGSIPFVLAVLLAWAIMSGRLSTSGCLIVGIWICGALAVAALTLLAFAEQAAGKSFAERDLQFVAVCWLVLFLPWLARRVGLDRLKRMR